MPSARHSELPLDATSITELVDRVRSGAGPLIVCECPSPTPEDGTVWLWVLRESAQHGLQQCWAGVLTRPEIDELVSQLRQHGSVWRGRINTRHGPPSKRFRLVWTVAPAPCRIYPRRGWVIDVESAGVTRHLLGRREQLFLPSFGVVEGWISRDWTCAGISLRGQRGEDRELVRLKNEGLFTQFLLVYDGIGHASLSSCRGSRSRRSWAGHRCCG